MGINTDLVVNTSVRMKNAKKVLDDVAVEAFNNFITLKKWGDIEVNKDTKNYPASLTNMLSAAMRTRTRRWCKSNLLC